MTSTPASRAVEAVWRIEAARLIAGLARLVHDVGRAEDLAQDALVAALEQWPTSGIPDRPGAWLMTVAKRRAVDEIRRDVTLAGKVELLGRELPEADELELPQPVEDDVLRLMFTACHPVLTPEAQAALTLKMLAGLTTDEIARAFLVPPATMAQRIVRAKRTLADARVGFESPGADELAPRLAAVLAVVYLVFNEGYAATAGEDLVRPALCEEAMRLGRILAALEPDEPEVHALLALMELQASRLHARTGPDGAIVTLLDQDRGRWDQLLISRGLAGLARAEQLGGAVRRAGRDRRRPRPGPDGGRDRLAAHRRAVRRAGAGGAVAGRRAEPGGRRLDGRRSGGRPRAGRRPGGTAGQLLPAAQCPRRPAGQAGPPR